MSYVNLCPRLVCVNSMHAAFASLVSGWSLDVINAIIFFRANALSTCQTCEAKTTNSNHNYYIYPDLLNVTPKFVADTFGSMVVADITYVATCQGWAYLSLLTDAGSRYSRICPVQNTRSGRSFKGTEDGYGLFTTDTMLI